LKLKHIYYNHILLSRKLLFFISGQDGAQFIFHTFTSAYPEIPRIPSPLQGEGEKNMEFLWLVNTLPLP
jgi:hypothetical protein